MARLFSSTITCSTWKRSSCGLFTLVSLCAALLAACGPAPTAAPTLPPPTATFNAGLVQATFAQVTDWAAAFDAHDAAKIISFYSPAAVEYDATLDPGYYLNFSAIEGFYRSGDFKTSFEFLTSAFFVSGDGRFAAVYGAMKDVEGFKPALSLLEFKQGKIIWQYDYYGGWNRAGPVGPWLAFPDSANQPDPSNAAATQAALSTWEAAFKSRDIRSFLSIYHDQGQVTDVIDPQWRIFKKPDLEKEMTARFASPGFKSTLGDFFVSANGHFVAVQGVYKDQKTANIPFVSILEMESGQIFNQFNFMVYRETN